MSNCSQWKALACLVLTLTVLVGVAAAQDPKSKPAQEIEEIETLDEIQDENALNARTHLIESIDL